MSLLMEALRKAEREKTEASEESERLDERLEPVAEPVAEGGEEDSLLRLDLSELPEESFSVSRTLQPVPDSPSAMNPDEELAGDETGGQRVASSVEPVPDGDAGERLAEEPASRQGSDAPEPVANGGDRESREKKTPDMAQALFQARARTRRHVRLVFLLAVTSVLCLVALGAWYYFETQMPQTFVAAPRVEEHESSLAVGQPPVPQPSAEEIDPNSGEPAGAREGQVVAELPKDTAPTPGEVPAGSSPQLVAQAPAPLEGKAKRKEQQAPVAKPKQNAIEAGPPASAAEVYRQALDEMGGSASPESAIQIRRSTRKPRSASPVQAAWKAFQERRYREADRLYAAILADHPLNRDALLGRAAIALAEGRKQEAQNLYLRLLERDPEDPLAIAGMVSLRGRQQPVAAIARMRQLIDRNPGNGTLHFILGNLYAAQSRWGYAQKAYFKAYASDPENAIYLFNLAVSLDHLGKTELALKFYRQALLRAEKGGAGFSLEAVARRIRALEGKAGGDA